ncbi:MAG: DUF481 domain-containing protein [Pseudomonadota bacterium]
MPDKTIPLLQTAAACVLALTGAAPASATLPSSVRDMIEAARDTGDPATLDAIVRVARRTNPDAGAEIDALLPLPRLMPLAVTPMPGEGIPVTIADIAPPVIWRGEGELGGFLTTGKTESVGGSVLFKVSREEGPWKHSLAGRADYQETGGILSREFFQLAYKADWRVSDAMYAYGLSSYERDRLAGFYGRVSTGAGLGVKLANTEEFRVNLEGGPAVRHSYFTDLHQETALSARGALGIDWRITPGLRAQQNASVYTEPGATSVESTTALDTRLMKKLSARLSHSLRYERGPLATSVGTDTVTRASVVYNF